MTVRRWAVLFLFSTVSAVAHVGSPDIFIEGLAGEYPLYVTVRPPAVIPGVAELEVRSERPGVTAISAVPLPLVGPGSKLAPVPDQLQRSKQDGQFFTGALWMMAPGSWQIKLTVNGAAGTGTLAIPIPAAALSTKPMNRSLAAMLFGLMTLLVLGVVAITGAAVREAQLEPGVPPDARQRQKGRRAMAIAFGVVILSLTSGGWWWHTESANYAAQIYRPIAMSCQLEDGRITLRLQDPGWLNKSKSLASLPVLRSVDDLILDHNHLMHLYVVREPALDVIDHLHPDLVNPGTFKLQLPALPAGHYKLYADIVHASGFPETLVSSVVLPGAPGRPLAGDDSAVAAPPWDQSPAGRAEAILPDGYRMRWLDAVPSVRAKQALSFRFELLDPQGKAPADMALYMGMTGHAAFLKTDGTAFAHIHPNGSASMAALMQAQGQDQPSAMSDMPGMPMSVPNVVSFPYGLPSPGRYRIVVQMKHGQTIESGVFDLSATG